MIGKFYCRVFCHIISLGDKISNTAATIQPNPFGFGKNFTVYIALLNKIALRRNNEYPSNENHFKDCHATTPIEYILNRI